ncbi:MAG: RHS repeat-associated core domain-containing protein, partial [Planctomycetes bacterium]|nr:RHS repeat-associated core domain-containing protein [Planctomycetota bacterium]
QIYVHGAGVDEMLAKIDGNGTVFYHQDALGSTTAITNETGQTVESYRYDAFGKAKVWVAASDATQSDSSVGNRFMFTGREWIGAASLYDYRNRVYSVELGRFLQTDPILFDGGDCNLYSYVGNRPMLLVDPYGLDWLDGMFEAVPGLADAVIGFDDNGGRDAANFVAGFGDSASFGASGLARSFFFGQDGVDYNSSAYKWGGRTQVAADLATLGASAGLKAALKAKGRAVARAEANAAIKGMEQTQHHIHPVLGNWGGAASKFPTGGLPKSIHSGKWNLKKVAPGPRRGVLSKEHAALHRRAELAENVVHGSAMLGPARLLRNELTRPCP